MSSAVAIPTAADPETALAHFEQRLRYETDCWDTHAALAAEVQDFVLLDVRSLVQYQRGHIPGAVSLPHGKIVTSKLKAWPMDTLFVVYCAGPHCNAANKAAVALARLGRPVKEMIGGMVGWADEGFSYFAGLQPGHIRDVEAQT